MYSNRTHANRPTAWTAADHARTVQHTAPAACTVKPAHVFKLGSLLLLAILALSAIMPAHAGNAPESIKTFESAPGESLDSFALRISPWAVNWTGNKGAELCGEFRKVGDRYAIELQTIRSAFACDYAKTTAPDFTGQSFHTHTKKNGFAFSAGDFGHPGYMAKGYRVTHHSGSVDSVRSVRR